MTMTIAGTTGIGRTTTDIGCASAGTRRLEATGRISTGPGRAAWSIPAHPRASRPRGRLRALSDRLRLAAADETGAATAEYAVATMAAVGFAGLLVLILRGDEVRGILTDLVRRALTVAN